MDALILAAGFGSRLRDVSDCKPLTPVRGMALLELGIRQAASAGAKRAVVVTGYRAEVIEAALPAIARNAGIPIIAQRVEDWSLPNGYSVMAGAARIVGDYLLMMSDHIFSRSILADLINEAGADRDVTLAIDRRVDSPLVDPDDATWVRLDERGYIAVIGKQIAPYDAVDCGAFLATPALSPAIAEAIAAGRPGSLSDGMQRLADNGRAATLEIGGTWWIDVDDPRALAIAEAEAPSHLSDIYAERAPVLTSHP